MARLLFVVARHNYPLYEYLKRKLSGENGIRVILDRRRGDRRQRIAAPGQEKRKGPRRRQHARQDDLRSYGLAVLLQQPGQIGVPPGDAQVSSGRRRAGHERTLSKKRFTFSTN